MNKLNLEAWRKLVGILEVLFVSFWLIFASRGQVVGETHDLGLRIDNRHLEDRHLLGVLGLMRRRVGCYLLPTREHAILLGWLMPRGEYVLLSYLCLLGRCLGSCRLFQSTLQSLSRLGASDLQPLR